MRHRPTPPMPTTRAPAAQTRARRRHRRRQSLRPSTRAADSRAAQRCTRGPPEAGSATAWSRGICAQRGAGAQSVGGCAASAACKGALARAYLLLTGCAAPYDRFSAGWKVHSRISSSCRRAAACAGVCPPAPPRPRTPVAPALVLALAPAPAPTLAGEGKSGRPSPAPPACLDEPALRARRRDIGAALPPPRAAGGGDASAPARSAVTGSVPALPRRLLRLRRPRDSCRDTALISGRKVQPASSRAAASAASRACSARRCSAQADARTVRGEEGGRQAGEQVE